MSPRNDLPRFADLRRRRPPRDPVLVTLLLWALCTSASAAIGLAALLYHSL